MTVLTVKYDDGTSVEVDVRTRHLLAAEARFGASFDTARKITASMQAAYCAARADADERRPFDEWVDAVEGIEPAGEVQAAADSSNESPPLPPT